MEQYWLLSMVLITERDHYAVLGVKRNADTAEIRTHYKALAKLYHPDKPTGDEAKFIRVNEAHAVLSDSELRQQYDEQLLPHAWQQQQHTSNMPRRNPHSHQQYYSRPRQRSHSFSGAQFSYSYGGGSTTTETFEVPSELAWALAAAAGMIFIPVAVCTCLPLCCMCWVARRCIKQRAGIAQTGTAQQQQQ
jgi:curved DNA-binding protein CbpA